MSTKENEVIKPEEETAVSAQSPGALPSYLQAYEGETGVENLQEFIKPPRLKIVQKQADDSLLERFSVGDMICTPAQELVVNKGEPLVVAPLFFWPEWATWNPYELKDNLDTIAYRTTDPEDPLVAKCRNPNMRSEDYVVNGEVQVDKKGSPLKLTHCEHLNYLLEILSGPQAGSQAIISFFRAQHQDGTNFAQLIKMRKAPLFATQFELKTYQKSYSGNSWYGTRISNPQTVAPFATEEEFEFRKKIFEEMTTAHAKGQIIVDHDDDPNVVDGEASSAESKKF